MSWNLTVTEMELKGKDESFVSEWLTKQGFKPAVADAFFRKNLNVSNISELTSHTNLNSNVRMFRK